MYRFKFLQEMAWAGGITALTFVITGFIATNDATDWRVWVGSTLIGAARAAAGAGLAYIPKLVKGDSSV